MRGNFSRGNREVPRSPTGMARGPQGEV
jgi:hypothetical protein